jgi:hypothetical protein
MSLGLMVSAVPIALISAQIALTASMSGFLLDALAAFQSPAGTLLSFLNVAQTASP